MKQKFEYFHLLKKCETLVKQTHTEPQETLEFKTTTPREIFSFKTSISVEGFWTIGIKNLEVYTCVFNKEEKKSNSNSIFFPNRKPEGLQMKKTEMRLKRTWKFRILQLPIFKMK